MDEETIWLVWCYDYEQSHVDAVYDSEELAEAHATRLGDDCGVEPATLRRKPPTWEPYFHGMAQVGCENPAFDRNPFVERAGETDEWEPDANERVATCPGSRLIGDDRSLGDAIWLSVFDMDEKRALHRVTEKFAELRQRREAGPIPSWHELTREEFASP